MRWRLVSRVLYAFGVASICSECSPPPNDCQARSAPHAHFIALYDDTCNPTVSCGIVCDEGFEDCDLQQDDGCETSSFLPPHMVGSPCAPASCESGFYDCNHSPADGCEHHGICPISKTDAGDDAGPVCAPATSFDDAGAPTWTPPISSNVCSPKDIADFDQACFTTSSTSCDDWMKAHVACGACLVTKPTAPTFGALVLYGDVYYANIGGCIALVSGDASSTSCGAKMLESYECEALVCAQCDSQDFAAYLDCTSAADKQQPCSAYQVALCDAPDGGAVYDACFSEQNFDDYVTKLGALFCSNGSADASTD